MQLKINPRNRYMFSDRQKMFWIDWMNVNEAHKFRKRAAAFQAQSSQVTRSRLTTALFHCTHLWSLFHYTQSFQQMAIVKMARQSNHGLSFGLTNAKYPPQREGVFLIKACHSFRNHFRGSSFWEPPMPCLFMLQKVGHAGYQSHFSQGELNILALVLAAIAIVICRCCWEITTV